MGRSSTPTIIQSKPKTPTESDQAVEDALERERLERLRRAGRASTLLSDASALKTKLGE